MGNCDKKTNKHCNDGQGRHSLFISLGQNNHTMILLVVVQLLGNGRHLISTIISEIPDLIS